MEEIGAQVAPSPPLYIHKTLSSNGYNSQGASMASKKRDLACQIPNFQHHQHRNWNPNGWDWDNVRFVAKPLELGTASTSKHELPLNHHFTSTHHEDDESLRLNLGGVLNNTVEEASSRSSKKVRSGSPATTTSYPMCQVDNCKEDLSTAKDYHRRHKVCEVHSKSSQALVGKQMQRFCQQCSRFHLLSEFDEGKRSCRRRLAGHNRRRRKTQPEDVSSRMVLPGSRETAGNESIDIVKLLTALARTQGKTEDKSANYSTGPDRDQLIQILSKIDSLPLPKGLAEQLFTIGSGKITDQPLLEYQNKLHVSASSPSTVDLHRVLSATSGASLPDALAVLSQRNSHSSDSEKSKVTSSDQLTGHHQQKRPNQEFTSVAGEKTSSCYQSPAEDSDCHIPETRPTIPLQLFSSSPDNDSPPNLASSRKHFSSDSSNPIEETSPSSSPPFVHKLFPLHSMAESIKSEKTSMHGDISVDVSGSNSQVCTLPLELFKDPSRGNASGAFENFPCHGGYTSSGSDRSPSSQRSGAQDRTGRIIFKLFDKDPGHLPETLRTQIYNWLSSSPSEMESYIRPGCVLLSIYVAMSSSAWEQLDRNLLQHVDSLVQGPTSDLWRSGRFLLQTGKQLASHKDGRIRLCKSWSSSSTPELISISPLAVVGGQENSLLLRGKNLTNPGTKLLCTDMGGYTSLKVRASTCTGSIYDEIHVLDFKIHVTSPKFLGRCFVEVENGFKGTCFPVIVADATICKELRLLERELDEEATTCNIGSGHVSEFGPPNPREQIIHFLNEVGWLFQRKRPSVSKTSNYSSGRFKFLLVFSVARDYCVLVKTILDMLVEGSSDGSGLSGETLETLKDIELLNWAVKRRSRKMVEMLINYSVKSDNTSSKQYIFPPNLIGRGGVTPLHLAACTLGSEDLIDALTNDPLEIGLSCWKNQLDASGRSPHDYAIMTQNHSYNALVFRKLADRRNCQISVTITNELEQPLSAAEQECKIISRYQQARRCDNCATVAANYYRGRQGSRGLLQQPYIHSMLAIAAVCVCVCLCFRGAPNIGLIAPFKWENLEYGTM